jgi:hypothetical protein
MFFEISFGVALLWASHVSCAAQKIPRGELVNLVCQPVANNFPATSVVPRAAVTIEPRSEPMTSRTCCYVSSENVAQIIWYTSIIEITVATVSTIV